MSAITSLIASNEKGILPPRIDFEENDIEITLVGGQAVPFQSSHVDQSTIADANYYLPILWLSVFSPKDLFKVTLDGDTYACPSVEVTIAKQRFALRRSLIQATFPHFLEQIALWEQALNEIEHDYLTIDGSQVFFMKEDNVFAAAFEQALRWFENGSREDFQGIITLASLSYEPENKRYSVWKQPKLHFTGFLYDHVETGDEPEERDIDMPVSESMGGVVEWLH